MTRSIIEEIEDELMEDNSEDYDDDEEEEDDDDLWRSSFEKGYEKANKED